MDNSLETAKQQVAELLTVLPVVRDTVALEIREWAKDENQVKSNREADIYTLGALNMLNILRQRAGLPPYELLN